MKEEIDKLRNSAASSPKANKLVERQKKYINQLEGKVESKSLFSFSQHLWGEVWSLG